MLQVIQDDLTSNFTTTSASYVDTGLTVSITPSLASSKVLIIASASVYSLNGNNSIDNNAFFALLRSSTVLQEARCGVQGFSTSSNKVSYDFMNFAYLDSPNTTSATTYKIQSKKGDNTLSAIEASATRIASIIVFEIGA